MIDPKWLSEVLHVSGPKSFALAAAGGVIFVGRKQGWPLFDELPGWAGGLAAVAMIIFGIIAAMSFIAMTSRSCATAVGWAGAKMRKSRDRANFVSSIDEQLDSVTNEEGVILAYLVTNNQQFFTNTADGGRATTLIARGLIVSAARPGQRMSVLDVPFKVQDDVWKRLKERADDFVHEQPNSRPHPWRDRLF